MPEPQQTASRFTALILGAFLMAACSGPADAPAATEVTEVTTATVTEKPGSKIDPKNNPKKSSTTVTVKVPAPTRTAVQPPKPQNLIPGDGIWLVGSDIQAGTYRNQGHPGCYWARLSDVSGEGIVTNGLGANQVVAVDPSDQAFETAGCGLWTLVTTVDDSPPFPGTWLSLEIRGQFEAEVSLVQDRLNELGYGPIPVDGDFGPVTDSVVRQYQADSGLVVDGKVGPQTWDSLF